MSRRINISSGTHWENSIGYSRTARMGNVVVVAGTTAVDEDGNTVGIGNPYEQTGNKYNHPCDPLVFKYINKNNFNILLVR